MQLFVLVIAWAYLAEKQQSLLQLAMICWLVVEDFLRTIAYEANSKSNYWPNKAQLSADYFNIGLMVGYK